MAANRDGIKKGSRVKVEPVRKQKNIKAISKLLLFSTYHTLRPIYSWILFYTQNVRVK